MALNFRVLWRLVGMSPWGACFRGRQTLVQSVGWAFNSEGEGAARWRETTSVW